jgi:hypothetical protein
MDFFFLSFVRSLLLLSLKASLAITEASPKIWDRQIGNRGGGRIEGIIQDSLFGLKTFYVDCLWFNERLNFDFYI